MRFRRRRPAAVTVDPDVSEELAAIIDRTRQAAAGLNDLNQRILDREVNMMRSLVAGGGRHDEQTA